MDEVAEEEWKNYNGHVSGIGSKESSFQRGSECFVFLLMGGSKCCGVAM